MREWEEERPNCETRLAFWNKIILLGIIYTMDTSQVPHGYLLCTSWVPLGYLIGKLKEKEGEKVEEAIMCNQRGFL